MIESERTIQSKLVLLGIVLGNFFLVLRVFSYSWVTDDAFITFRSVLNLLGNNGPVYNIGERVQSFTHPLWFILLTFGGLLNTNLYFFCILIGLLFTCLMLWVLYRIYCETRNFWMYALALFALFCSESFVQFSTSGLENSLTDFLLIAFIWLVTKKDLHERKGSLIAPILVFSLVGINRADQVLLLIPVLAWILIKNVADFRTKLRQTLIGLSPIILWHSFSLFYYGFLFPNTKYAKLGGRSLLENATSGIGYFLTSLSGDLLAMPLMITIVLALVTFSIVRLAKKQQSPQPVADLLALGVVAYLLYIVFVTGGDFMRGRFFVSAVLVSLATLLFIPTSRNLRNYGFLLIPATTLLGLFSCWNGATESVVYRVPGVENERNYYRSFLGLNLNPEANYTNHSWAVAAKEIKETSILGVNGQRGYWLPLDRKIVDVVGLTDAFIARTPIIDNRRSGHFVHEIPDEYLKWKLAGISTEVWQDEEQHDLFRSIQVITESRELISVERLQAMVSIWQKYGL